MGALQLIKGCLQPSIFIPAHQPGYTVNKTSLKLEVRPFHWSCSRTWGNPLPTGCRFSCHVGQKRGGHSHSRMFSHAWLSFACLAGEQPLGSFAISLYSNFLHLRVLARTLWHAGQLFSLQSICQMNFSKNRELTQPTCVFNHCPDEQMSAVSVGTVVLSSFLL